MNANRIKSQQGAALVVSLVILIALTLLGVTSMKSASTEISMAGNLRETGLSFQAAEAGLRSAESIVAESTTHTTFDGLSVSLLDENTADPDYMAKESWEGASATTVTLANISNNPQYIIKYLGIWSQNPLDLVNTGQGYGAQSPGRIISNYRITSRGSGQTGTTFRTVQSYYGIEY